MSGIPASLSFELTLTTILLVVSVPCATVTTGFPISFTVILAVSFEYFTPSVVSFVSLAYTVSPSSSEPISPPFSISVQSFIICLSLFSILYSILYSFSCNFTIFTLAF